MRIGIRPTVDVVFKRVFGSAESAGITLSFLNALLPLVGCPRAASVEILNPWRLADFSGDKDIAVDVRARDDRGRDFQIEMQVRPEALLAPRVVDNAARIYAGQLGRGHSYERHRPVIAIWILDHEQFPDAAWLHSFRLEDVEHHLCFGSELLIVTIELPKRRVLPDFDEGTIFKSGIDEWLYFLCRGEDLDPDSAPASEATREIREALEIMAVFTKQERARHSYEKRLDYERSLKGMLEAARKEGLAEGKVEGIFEGIAEATIDAARKMKDIGISLDIIAKITGLTTGEIEGISPHKPPREKDSSELG